MRKLRWAFHTSDQIVGGVSQRRRTVRLNRFTFNQQSNIFITCDDPIEKRVRDLCVHERSSSVNDGISVKMSIKHINIIA